MSQEFHDIMNDTSNQYCDFPKMFLFILMMFLTFSKFIDNIDDVYTGNILIFSLI